VRIVPCGIVYLHNQIANEQVVAPASFAQSPTPALSHYSFLVTEVQRLRTFADSNRTNGHVAIAVHQESIIVIFRISGLRLRNP